MVGVFDLASNVTEGIRNTTTAFDEGGLDRVRLPRVVAVDGVLKPYNIREAAGSNSLHLVEDGRFANEHYLSHLGQFRLRFGFILTACVEFREKKLVLFLTDRRVLCARLPRYPVEWTIPFNGKFFTDSICKMIY